MQKIWLFLGQAVLTTLSAQRYDRCLCHGQTTKILKRSKNRLTIPLLSIARTIEATIKSMLFQLRRHCATQALQSSSFQAWECSASERTRQRLESRASFTL